MSEPLETLDKDKKAMSEAIKKDIEKDKENLARVEADRDEKGYEKDDDKKAQKLDKEIAKDKASPNMMISFTKRTIGLNEIKNETMPSVIKKKLKTTHAW